MGMELVDLLYPKRCVGCDKGGKYFCFDCRQKLRLSREYLGAGAMDGVVSVFAYRGVMKKAIEKFKFRFVSDLVGELMELIVESGGVEEEGRYFKKKGFVVMPVPLHRKRERWRGFNQAAELGKVLAQELGLEFDDKNLKRIKETKAQSKLNKEERLINIQGAFVVNGQLKMDHGKLPGKVLLVDDVWTTGATMKECARVLRGAGVEMVWGFTVAR